MEVDDAAAYNTATSSMHTPANEVQPHTAQTSAQRENNSLSAGEQISRTLDNSAATEKDSSAIEEETISNKSLRLVVSSDEEHEESTTIGSVARTVSKRTDQTAVDETVAIYCAKRKRYEVSRLGSEEILLGCDDESGEACLVSELKLNNNMAEDKHSATTKESAIEAPLSQENADTKAPAAKRLKKSPAHSAGKASPRTENVEKTSKTKVETRTAKPVENQNKVQRESVAEIQETEKNNSKAHIVADNDEHLNNNVATTKSATRSSNKSSVAATTPAKPLSAQDEFYKKPFTYGWKRELVWRATAESGKDRADVYFISPGGKKIRTRHDIPPLLQGDLKLEHFCWIREALGAGPEFETVRNAKPSNRATATHVALAATPSPIIGKRISKPKGPKGASPPPQGWTPTRALKVNNAALNSRSSTGLFSASTPTQSRHAGGSTTRSTSGSSSSNSSKKKQTPTTTGNVVGIGAVTVAVADGVVGGGGNGVGDSGLGVGGIVAAIDNAHMTDDAVGSGTPRERTIHEPCTIMCPRASGKVPQLQCVKCLCLYHHECVGLSSNNTDYRVAGNGTPGRDYVCETCLSKSLERTKEQPTATSPTKTAILAAVSAAAKASHTSRTPSVSKSSSSRSPAVSKRNGGNKLPQSIAVVKGKKYVVVDKPRTTNVAAISEYANDIENDLKQINESIRNSLPTQPALATLDAAFQQQQTASGSSGSAAHISSAASQLGRNFFSNMSYAFESLLIILKYLKIHVSANNNNLCLQKKNHTKKFDMLCN